MRFSILPGALVCASIAFAQTPAAADDVLTSANYKPLTGEGRASFYLKDTLGSPLIYLAAIGGGGLGQLTNSPPEWKQGVEGYAKRTGSVLGTLVIGESIEQGSAALLGYERRYVSCGCKGILRRTGHAVVWTIITKNNAGANRLNIPQLMGAYGSGMITTLWYPDRFDPLKDGVRAGSQQMGFAVGASLFREFTPDLKRMLRRH